MTKLAGGARQRGDSFDAAVRFAAAAAAAGAAHFMNGEFPLMPMRRLVPLILFVVGVALLVGGITRLAPLGTTAVGGGLCVFGALLFGLSFIPYPNAAPDADSALSPAARVTGIFFEPATVFRNLRAHPRWLAPFLIIAFCTALYQIAFVQRVTPEAIANKMADKIIEGGFIPAERQATFREQQLASATAPMARVGQVTNAAVGLFVVMTLIAAVYLLGVTMFGGRINFWQALCVAFYAALPVVVIGRLLSLLLLYLKSPDDLNLVADQNGLVRDNLGILFAIAEHPVLHVAASFIGILSFYGLWLAATGLRNTGEKVSSSAAWSTAIAVWLIGLTISIISASLFSNFLT